MNTTIAIALVVDPALRLQMVRFLCAGPETTRRVVNPPCSSRAVDAPSENGDSAGCAKRSR